MSSPASQPPRVVTPTQVIVRIVVGVAAGVLIVFVVLAALMLPVIYSGREAARRSLCFHKLKSIGLALDTYHSVHGTFPPAYLADENGRPMHSWRVLILPYLGWNDLYEAYRFDEPWDGPNNRNLLEKMPPEFACPSATDSAGLTNYVAVVGSETMWPGANRVDRRQIADGTGQTIAVVETAGAGIPWLEPRDLTVAEAEQGIKRGGAGRAISSYHPGGAAVLFGDTSVHFLDESTPPERIRALLTIAGGEEADPTADDF